MTSYPPLYNQLMEYLRQHSHYSDKRHLITLSWMVMGVLLSQSLHLTEWEPFVQSRATQAQSYQKRWSRFLKNHKIEVERIYIYSIGDGSNQQLDGREIISSFRHDNVVEQILHDSFIYYFWWSSNSILVVS